MHKLQNEVKLLRQVRNNETIKLSAKDKAMGFKLAAIDHYATSVDKEGIHTFSVEATRLDAERFFFIGCSCVILVCLPDEVEWQDAVLPELEEILGLQLVVHP